MNENKEPRATTPPEPAHPELRTARPTPPLLEDAGSTDTHQMRVVARRRNEAEAKLAEQRNRSEKGPGTK